jgi:single-strand binding family protein
MKLYIAPVDENKKLVVGKVTDVDFSEKVANVTIEGSVWNKETQTEDLESLTIAFYNNDKVKMRDFVEKAKVEEGKVISAMIYEKDGKITGNSFKYNGVWEYTTPTGKQNYVFHGVVVNPTVGTTPTGKDYTKFSMAMNPVKDEETQWANITCWNNENNTLADRARKIFADHADQKKKAIVVCGNETEYNGRKQYVGYRFDLLD